MGKRKSVGIDSCLSQQTRTRGHNVEVEDGPYKTNSRTFISTRRGMKGGARGHQVWEKQSLARFKKGLETFLEERGIGSG